MGIRLAMFALDLPQFDRLVDQTLGDLLWQHQRTAKETMPRSALHCYERATDNIYHSVQSKGVLGDYKEADGTRVSRTLTELETGKIPFLQQSGRQFLSGSACEFLLFLRAFGECERSDFVRCVTDGGRRWWIGCVLHYAKEVLHLGEAEYRRLELLWRKVLRGWNCGYPISEGDIGVDLSGFSVTPDPNDDPRIGFWRQEETLLAAQHAASLLQHGGAFRRPPASPDVYPSDEICDEWVRSELQALARLNEAKSENRVVVSFIG